MALITCPECGKDVSDKASSCPNCGCPISGNKSPSLNGMNVCPACGKFIIGKEKCPDCGTTMIDCNCSESEFTDMLLDGTLEKWEQRIREKYVINSELYNKRIASEKAENDYYDNIPTIPTVECPYCKSTNSKKVSTASKVGNTVLFGIFGQKRKYQWHCNNCKSDF